MYVAFLLCGVCVRRRRPHKKGFFLCFLLVLCWWVGVVGLHVYMSAMYVVCCCVWCMCAQWWGVCVLLLSSLFWWSTIDPTYISFQFFFCLFSNGYIYIYIRLYTYILCSKYIVVAFSSLVVGRIKRWFAEVERTAESGHATRARRTPTAHDDDDKNIKKIYINMYRVYARNTSTSTKILPLV